MKKINKKAFTLIELLAVIIILAVIALIATPIVLDVVESAKISAFESTAYGMIDAMKLKSAEDMIDGNSMAKEYTFPSTELDVQGSQLTGTGKVDSQGRLTIAVNNGKWCATKGFAEGTITVKEYVEGECTLPVESGSNDPVVYKDNSGANTPDLLDNMIPVKYENGSWVYADITQEWYDYDKQEWANAVVLNADAAEYEVNDPISMDDIALMYVWIPRYTYTIFNGNNGFVEPQVIDITFERGTASNGTVSCTDVDFVNNPTSTVSEICTDTTNGSIVNGTSTYTHPAFNFGGVPLTGFWVGKFEVSGTTNTITIKPNVASLRRQNISTFFTAIQNISTTYSLNGDSHMMKNMEWGAVAYLKQSEYGLGLTSIGTSDSYDNAGGEISSTTGNVYGVYEMSGGNYEYTMGNMVDLSGTFYSSGSGFTTPPDSKYYDAYAYDASSDTTYVRGKLGDATKEILLPRATSGWEGDYAKFPYSSSSWFLRGGYYGDDNRAGVFNFTNGTGGGNGILSVHAVIVR